MYGVHLVCRNKNGGALFMLAFRLPSPIQPTPPHHPLARSLSASEDRPDNAPKISSGWISLQLFHRLARADDDAFLNQPGNLARPDKQLPGQHQGFDRTKKFLKRDQIDVRGALKFIGADPPREL